MKFLKNSYLEAKEIFVVCDSYAHGRLETVSTLYLFCSPNLGYLHQSANHTHTCILWHLSHQSCLLIYHKVVPTLWLFLLQILALENLQIFSGVLSGNHFDKARESSAYLAWLLLFKSKKQSFFIFFVFQSSNSKLASLHCTSQAGCLGSKKLRIQNGRLRLDKKGSDLVLGIIFPWFSQAHLCVA